MKIGGVEVRPCEAILVLPRPSGDDIVVRAKSVSVNEEFDKLVPEPEAPAILVKGESKRDYTDEDYVKAVRRRDSMRFAYLCLRSIEDSEIEWERVNMDKPSTWLEWDKEMMEAGLSEVEVGRIVNLVMEANSLDEAKIEEARKAFLRGQGA